MLVNEAVEVRHGPGHLWVIGLDDPHYYGCDDLPGALHDVPASAFKILLVHSPEIYREAAARGIDLYLCGHTHGGQIRLPLLGPLWLNARAPRRVKRGRWTQGGMQGFTSAGVGTSLLPVRFLCAPEIGLIELRCPRHGAGSTPAACLDSVKRPRPSGS
jgi:predicted MPP superfamily phosphohydrolase